ncbi:unnamed protein product, partial [Onchocerca flexuosa]|uniref:Uncharacterized protein n=1 Tax=Onchocerca flexuosa TaxID=387005 RepID=A0A183I8A7_9BILA
MKNSACVDVKKPIDDGRRSVIKDESKTLENSDKAKEEQEESLPLTFPEAALATKTEIPDEILLSQCTDNGLQIVAADTSTEDEESPTNRSSTSVRSTSSKRIGRGKGESRGRGRRRKASTPLRSNEDVIARASSEVRRISAELSDEVPNLVVDDVEPTSDEEKSSSRQENATRSHRGRSRGPGSARGTRKKRTAASRKTIPVNNSDTSDKNNRSTKGRKRKAVVNT